MNFSCKLLQIGNAKLLMILIAASAIRPSPRSLRCQGERFAGGVHKRRGDG